MFLEQHAERVDKRLESLVSGFDSSLSSVLSRAQVRVALSLQSKLSFEPGGVVRTTASNVRTLRSLPEIFRKALSEEGYDGLASGFLGTFDGTVPLFEEVLGTIVNTYQIKPVSFTAADRAYFREIKQGVALNFEEMLDRTAQVARQNTLFSVGGQPFDKTAVQIAERLHTTLGQARTLASTGITTFYRTVAEQGYDKIEEALAPVGKELRYTYMGPKDKLNRPFCSKLASQALQGKTWTRAQIDRMDNEQIPDVFRTCGGFNCRHQWVISLEN